MYVVFFIYNIFSFSTIIRMDWEYTQIFIQKRRKRKEKKGKESANTCNAIFRLCKL